MKKAEFKLSLPGVNREVTLDTVDVKVLLLRSGTTIGRLAERIGCSREHLSRCINGIEIAPEIRRRLIPELAKMLQSQQLNIRTKSATPRQN